MYGLNVTDVSPMVSAAAEYTGEALSESLSLESELEL
ncbi:hypothetical protein PF008_g14174 [Phytophthora fragariae]|uniref:Uncharacterized protein n=1 Tax=Phytophthora fragariae TaxID=53985 RepID=A0A6G0RJ69_9STRA|nr:hypothetical protein PF008_g14174 [Phytophthora fragariae]